LHFHLSKRECRWRKLNQRFCRGKLNQRTRSSTPPPPNLELFIVLIYHLHTSKHNNP
jgi:hypothetical protein